MALRVISDGRTVSIVSPFEVVKRNGTNGEFEQKSILFKVAFKRNYKQNLQKADGSTERGYGTDFLLVKATGEVAEAFNKNCTATNAEGKLISRHILIDGRLETYSKPRPINVQANINGQLYNIQTEVPNSSNMILVADQITYLDSNPNKKTESGPAPVNVTPVGAGEAQGAVAQAMPQATIQAQAMPQQAMPQAQYMNAPVMGAVNTDEAPFA